MPSDRKLCVFLCHSNDDKPAVRELYGRLKNEGWIDPWLDEEKLYPGQDWDLEIEKAVEAADAVITFLSSNSIDKEGYVQAEMRMIMRMAMKKPEGIVFLIPLRLDECDVPFRLRSWQYVDYFPENRKEWAINRLLDSLKIRAQKLGLPTKNTTGEQVNLELEECARCVGQGYIEFGGRKLVCPVCKGKKVQEKSKAKDIEGKCSRCSGKGYIEFAGRSLMCAVCKGKGFVSD